MNIGRYEVVRELGKGGMAVVYLATDPYMKRQVAIKVLPHQFTHDPQFRVRFQREAEFIAALEHGSIVPVYDFGEHEDQPYIVMRYLPGGTLRDRLTNGALPISEITPIFQSIASALDYAHKKGVIHRDIKPGNILFDSEGKANLSDFGIAKLQEASAAFTGTGDLIGTPNYVSPEQAMGEKHIDGRADIYSMGVVLFECLTGELPFKADTPMGVAIAHIQSPIPSLLDRNPDLPPAFEEIIRKALDKKPKNRFENTTALAQAIQDRESMLDPDDTFYVTPSGKVVHPSLASASSPSQAGPASTQGRVDVSLTPPSRPESAPAPKRSGLPGLIGVGGVILAIILFIGLIGGIGVGLIPNPFATSPAVVMTEAPATNTPKIIIASVIPSPTQIVKEPILTATTAPLPTKASTATSSVPLPEITDGKGIAMVLIPAGRFSMGGSDLNAEPDEKPVHPINLDAYYIDKFEVTNAAYIACVEDGGACKPPIQKDSFTRSSYYGVKEYNDYPVVYVDWDMARNYCEWRGARLPTEAQWEKAARGSDDQRSYPWEAGRTDCQKANYNGPNGCYGGTTKVGSYAAGKSPYGVYDMAGNVWEWVADWYSERYYQTSFESNPLGPDSGQSRVLRGGSWTRQEFDIRVSNRNKFAPTYYNFDIGFRCASDVTP